MNYNNRRRQGGMILPYMALATIGGLVHGRFANATHPNGWLNATLENYSRAAGNVAKGAILAIGVPALVAAGAIMYTKGTSHLPPYVNGAIARVQDVGSQVAQGASEDVKSTMTNLGNIKMPSLPRFSGSDSLEAKITDGKGSVLEGRLPSEERVYLAPNSVDATAVQTGSAQIFIPESLKDNGYDVTVPNTSTAIPAGTYIGPGAIRIRAIQGGNSRINVYKGNSSSGSAPEGAHPEGD